MSKQALIVIDIQNDYFPDGAFPLWNSDAVLEANERAIARARAKNIPVILVQHVADTAKGPSPFFNADTPGVEVHERIRAAAPDASVVVKTHADAFHLTKLEETLSKLGVEELLISGMMTHNCVTHTAISKAAEKYAVKILPDCCTSVSRPIHLMALSAVSIRTPLVESTDIL